MVLMHEKYSTFVYLTFDGFGVMRDKYTWAYVNDRYHFVKKLTQGYHVWDGKSHPPDYIKRKRI